MQATDPHTIVVKWNSVPNAASYSFKYSTDPNVMLDVEAKYPHANETQVTLDALLPNTTYYTRIKANAGEGNIESAYSIIKAATTPVAGGGGNGGGGSGGDSEAVMNLRHWLNALDDVKDQYYVSLPEFDNVVLSPAERTRLLGAGVRRYGFIDQVSDMATEYSQFWPAYMADQGRLKELIREIEVLRFLVAYFESGARDATDMLLAVSHEAFRLANMYYRSVREADRDQVRDAATVFRMLNLFWKRRRRITDKPTEQEAVRDFKGVLHGTKDGFVAAEHTSGRAAKGQSALVDETRSPQRVARRSDPDSAEYGTDHDAEYDAGYNDGYNDGYDDEFDAGYNDEFETFG